MRLWLAESRASAATAPLPHRPHSQPRRPQNPCFTRFDQRLRGARRAHTNRARLASLRPICRQYISVTVTVYCGRQLSQSFADRSHAYKYLPLVCINYCFLWPTASYGDPAAHSVLLMSFTSFFFGPGNGSPTATNVVVLVVVGVLVVIRFSSLRLCRFSSDRHVTFRI